MTATYTLIVIHGPRPDREQAETFRDPPRQEVIVMGCLGSRPWMGLNLAGIEKVRQELNSSRRFTRCISVFERVFDPVLFGRLIETPLQPRTVVVPRIGTYQGAYEVQTAEPYLFCTDGLSFNRASEFQRSLDLNPSDIQTWSYEAQFYHHLKSVGLTVDTFR